MLKLKIGQNYLLLNYDVKKTEIDFIIAYMMGCFKKTGKLTYYNVYNNDNDASDIITTLNDAGEKSIYILQYLDYFKLKNDCQNRIIFQKAVTEIKYQNSRLITKLLSLKPDLDIKVINVNSYQQAPEFRLSLHLLDFLKSDKRNIAFVLPKLETYKYMSKRFQSIPNEIKVIDNDLKKLSKKTKTCERTTTLKSIEYLDLIEEAKISGTDLDLIIKELPIYPSEALGMVFKPDYFETNPYLYKAATYIYQKGYNFKMPRTHIKIDSSFRPRFIETLDHTFDTMFNRHNWSTVGYPHFGLNHLCAGEFNDAIAHAKEYGLDYYFITLKQYLTTANMRDCAGVKIWWYPIYDNDNNLVYCAGVDAFIEEDIKRNDKVLYEKIKAAPWPEKVKMVKTCGYTYNIALKYGTNNMSYNYHGEDAFMLVCEKKDIELYKKLRKDGKYND